VNDEPAVGKGGGTVQPLPAIGESRGEREQSLRAAAADFWLRVLMRLASHAPSVARGLEGFAVSGTWQLSRSIRHGTLANAARILGPHSSPAARRALAQGVLRNFYGFVCDLGRNRGRSIAELAAMVEEVEGDHSFVHAASQRRGIVIVTAHLGSFETGTAALRMRAERIHVVFKRDRLSVFESMRSEQRRNLGVMEAPLDDGWPVWLRLRNALLRDEIVLMQGDRLMPGQRGMRVRFLGGHIEIPTGAAKLALAAGSPILPVFAVRTDEKKLRLCVDEPIFVDAHKGAEQLRDLVLAIAKAIERRVARSPEQWLMLHPAWCEDQGAPEPIGDPSR